MSMTVLDVLERATANGEEIMVRRESEGVLLFRRSRNYPDRVSCVSVLVDVEMTRRTMLPDDETLAIAIESRLMNMDHDARTA